MRTFIQKSLYFDCGMRVAHYRREQPCGSGGLNRVAKVFWGTYAELAVEPRPSLAGARVLVRDIEGALNCACLRC